MITFSTALNDATRVLAPTSPSARVDAEILLRHVLGISRLDIAMRSEQSLTETQYTSFRKLIARRADGEPVAYLIGRREFWTLDLEVTSATLIPRPDTELLVERALACLPTDATGTILDLGTGSGAIGLAIARERPALRVCAVDRSEAALVVARNNAKRHAITNVEFIIGDWFEPVRQQRFHLIVSNPPYVKANDPHLREGDVRFEPREALVGGDDGLDAIRHIASDAPAHLLPGGLLMLEHGYDQAVAVRALLIKHGFRHVTTSRDLSGHNRVTEGRLP